MTPLSLCPVWLQWLLGVCGVVCLLKSGISLLHLITASRNMAAIDMADREKERSKAQWEMRAYRKQRWRQSDEDEQKKRYENIASIDEEELINHGTLQSLTEHLYLFEYRLSMVWH